MAHTPDYAPIVWSVQVYDFGDVEVNMADEYRFEWVNKSPTNVKIQGVSSNDLLEPFWQKGWIEPGKKGQLFVSLNPIQLGTFDVTLEVTFTDGLEQFEQYLRVKGHILSADEYQAKYATASRYMQAPPRPVAIPGAPPQQASIELTPPGPSQVHSPATQWKAKAAARTMQAMEQQILLDLNAFRQAPQRYVDKVKAYIEQLSDWYLEDITARHAQYSRCINAAHSLIVTLENATALPAIVSDDIAYNVLYEQGDFMQSQGEIIFKGPAGLSTIQRHSQADPTTKAVREIYYYEDQEAPADRILLHLLLNVDDPNHAIRKLLLQPQWTHAAVHQVGSVGTHSHFWAVSLLEK